MDTEKNKGMWLLPTRRRIANLARFFEGYYVTNATTPGLLLVQEDEYLEMKDQYESIHLPKGWSFFTTKGDSQGDKVREAWDSVKDLDWIGLVGDDNIPLTPDWDKSMLSALQGWNLVSCNDSWQAPQRLGNCWIWSGELLRAVGYAFPPVLNHLFVDDVWETLGRATGCWTTRLDIIVRHAHATLCGTEDETHKKAYSDDNWSHDTLVWEEWKQNSMQAAIDAIETLKAEKKIISREVDVSNLRLMIATPSGAGKFVTDYVTSLFGTLQMLNTRGVPYKWVVENGNADIAAARAELMMTFMNTDYTHLLMIDDDMGWDPMAFSRMLMANKDFVGVAGRKKRDQVMFAVNPLDQSSKIVEVPFDTGSGTAEVKEVGMAFVLLTRQCIQKMIDAYPDLKYRMQGESERYSLCLPMMVNNVYKGEDYAFCHRWRAVGGSVYVCPDVALKHVGQKTFEGAWIDTWVQSPRQLEAAE